MTDRLGDIIDRQRALQEAMGHDLWGMSGEERADYIRWNTLALMDELHEALAETRWKPWAKGEKGITDPEKFGGELVDALHFLINLFLVNQWDTDEIYRTYIAKGQVNHARQDAGYDGVSTKCANRQCRRALDEPLLNTSMKDVRRAQTRIGDLAWCHDGCYDAWVEGEGDLDEVGA